MYNMHRSISYYIELEPGDGTKYKFIINLLNEERNYVYIAGLDQTYFHGYAYRIDSIEDFFSNVGEVPFGEDNYSDWVNKIACRSDLAFLSYINEHSIVKNMYVILAGLIAVKITLLGGI